MRHMEGKMGGWVVLNQVTTVPLPTTSSSRLFNRFPSPLLSHGSCSLCTDFSYKYEKKRFGRLLVSCRGSDGGEGGFGSTSSPYDVLGLDPSCSLADLKTAFRSKVKEFHPDVYKDAGKSDAKIRRIIQAYELLMQIHGSDSTERECIDPFEVPECAANDLFINEAYCIGKGCPYSCVERAPYAFSFNIIYGTARAISQFHGEDYRVQLAVSECPRKCIHYVTPMQRMILEELLQSFFNCPLSSAELAALDSLLVKANYENNRYQQPKEKQTGVN